jgi:hypothetical protein
LDRVSVAQALSPTSIPTIGGASSARKGDTIGRFFTKRAIVERALLT